MRSGGWVSQSEASPRQQKLYKERSEFKRQEYLTELQKLSNSDGSNLIYMDEAGIDKEPVREYGWSPIGQRLIGEVSGMRHSRTSVIAGYSRFFKSLIAPNSYKGNTDSQKIYNWFENQLLPQLKQKTIETGIVDFVIVLDNASIHRSLKLKELVENSGYKLLFLAPYSPDYNPIEHIWWQLKLTLMRIRTISSTFYQDIEDGLGSMYRLMWA